MFQRPTGPPGPDPIATPSSRTPQFLFGWCEHCAHPITRDYVADDQWRHTSTGGMSCRTEHVERQRRFRVAGLSVPAPRLSS